MEKTYEIKEVVIGDHDLSLEEFVTITFGSDFNPGSCPCLNPQPVMNPGCLKYRMTPEEVLNSMIINAAEAIGKAFRMGSNLAHRVIKKGETVYLNEETD